MTPTYRLIENLAPSAWDNFVSAHRGHLLQSSGWGALKSKFGWSLLRLALEDRGALVAGAQVLLRQMPLGNTMAYVPRGPVWDGKDPDELAALLDALQDAARGRGAFVLKIEPDWEKGETRAGLAADPIAARGFLPTFGFQPRATIHLDLTLSLDQILAQMKPKWRYNIRLAGRKGVTVRCGGAADVTLFYQLLQTTGTRDRFAIHTLEYYQTAFAELAAGANAQLFIAECEGATLAAILVTAFGPQAIYLYGASGNAHRERMPNHALHWSAIQWAKEHGCTTYDLWGIYGAGPSASKSESSGESGNSEDAYASEGLYKFKQGFGGDFVEYVGAYDFVFSQIKYHLYNRLLARRRASAA